MHDIEPHYNWRHHYIAEEDERSPFFGREYNEFEFTNSIYGYCIHPQWDDIDSPTLFVKLLCVDYDEQFAIIEMLGEWNDCINNDIMFLKRDVIDKLIENGVSKFILIGENILNFHYSDESYYEEWKEDIAASGGWIALIGFRDHVLSELEKINLLQYFIFGEELDALFWRTYTPLQLYQVVDKYVQKQLSQGD
jgi:hypothetical protein